MEFLASFCHAIYFSVEYRKNRQALAKRYDEIESSICQTDFPKVDLKPACCLEKSYDEHNQVSVHFGRGKRK